MPVNYRPFSQREALMDAHLRGRMLGINDGAHACATICDPLGVVLHDTPIRSSGPGGEVPGWVYQEPTPLSSPSGAAMPNLRFCVTWRDGLLIIMRLQPTTSTSGQLTARAPAAVAV